MLSQLKSFLFNISNLSKLIDKYTEYTYIPMYFCVPIIRIYRDYIKLSSDMCMYINN